MPEQTTCLVYKFDTEFCFITSGYGREANSHCFICGMGQGSSIGRGWLALPVGGVRL